MASFTNSQRSSTLNAFAVHLHELLGKEADQNLEDGHSDNLLPLARIADQIEEVLIKQYPIRHGAALSLLAVAGRSPMAVVAFEEANIVAPKGANTEGVVHRQSRRQTAALNCA
ncbi:hypothetical protein [Loktanella sp. R86503]|uniref:hypothetical protein n=1 Tax=Loktanella sp. R86503 TaxID=3093847 RepID=UPI0036D9F6A4